MCLSVVEEGLAANRSGLGYKVMMRGDAEGLYRSLVVDEGDYRSRVTYRATAGVIIVPTFPGGLGQPNMLYPCGFHVFESLEDARSYALWTGGNRPIVEVAWEEQLARGLQAIGPTRIVQRHPEVVYEHAAGKCVVAAVMTILGEVECPKRESDFEGPE